MMPGLLDDHGVQAVAESDSRGQLHAGARWQTEAFNTWRTGTGSTILVKYIPFTLIPVNQRISLCIYSTVCTFSGICRHSQGAQKANYTSLANPSYPQAPGSSRDKHLNSQARKQTTLHYMVHCNNAYKNDRNGRNPPCTRQTLIMFLAETVQAPTLTPPCASERPHNSDVPHHHRFS